MNKILLTLILGICLVSFASAYSNNTFTNSLNSENILFVNNASNKIIDFVGCTSGVTNCNNSNDNDYTTYATIGSGTPANSGNISGNFSVPLYSGLNITLNAKYYAISVGASGNFSCFNYSSSAYISLGGFDGGGVAYKTFQIPNQCTSGGTLITRTELINYGFSSGVFRVYEMNLTYDNPKPVIRYLSYPNTLTSFTNAFMNLSSLASISGTAVAGYARINTIPATPNSNSNEANIRGEVITMTNTTYILNVTRVTGADATDLYIYNGSNSLLGNYTTATGVWIVNLPVTNGATYKLGINKTSGNSAQKYVTGASYPQTDIEFDWITGIYSGLTEDSTTYNSFESITTGQAGSTTTTNGTTNLTISVGGTNIYRILGVMNQTNNRTYNLANYLNNYLPNSNCASGECLIPFQFNAQREISNITYSDLQFNNIGFLENSQSYNATVPVTSYEGYGINISYDNSSYALATATLYYNGTSYTGTQVGSGSNILFTKSLNVPSVTTTTIIPFYWTVELTNLSNGIEYYNSTNHTQTISVATPINFTSMGCAQNTTALTFNFADEVNLTGLNATSVQYNFQYGIGNSTGITTNGSFSNINSFSLCINSTAPTYTIGYGEVDYSVTGYTDRKFYVFGGTRATNTTINNTLYSLPTASSTSFLLTAQDTSLSVYSGYYLSLLRWYPANNEYRVVEMSKTNTLGQGLFRVKTEDVDYRIGLYTTNGTLIKLDNPLRMVCLVNPCTYNMFVTPEGQDYTSLLGVQTSLTYSNVTNIFTFTWNDPSQLTSNMRLLVTKSGGITDTTLCDVNSTGFTGVLSCNIGNTTGTIVAKGFRSASPSQVITSLLVQIRDRIIDSVNGKAIGLIFTVFMLILMGLIGIFSPIVAIILGIIALIPGVLLGSIPIMVMVGVAIIGFTLFHLMRRT